MKGLEVQAAAMAWDWDADDIDVEDDDGKLWVPIMAQMLNTDTAKQVMRVYPPTGPVTPPRQMKVYTVQLN